MSSGKGQNLQKPVFFDTKGRRGRFASWFGITAAMVVTVLLAFFVISVLINPFLPQIKLKAAAILPQESDIQPHVPDRPLTKKETAVKQIADKAFLEKKKRDEIIAERASVAELARAAKKEIVHTGNEGDPLAIGFFVNWDDSSIASLRENYNKLDWLVPEWIRLSGDGSNPLLLDVDHNAMSFLKEHKPGMLVLPLLQNYKNEQWNADIVIRSISTEDQRRRLIGSLLRVIEQNKFGGLTIDIEEVPASAQGALFTFMTELHDEFQPRGLILAQAVPFDNDEWNYKAYASVTYYLMLMAYDQHWSTGEPGPVAAQGWYESILKKRMSELSPAKTIVCFGNYGYNWPGNKEEAETVSFQESLLAAKESLDAPEDIKFDPVSKNPYF
jgi:spore germination protein YaaH